MKLTHQIGVLAQLETVVSTLRRSKRVVTRGPSSREEHGRSALAVRAHVTSARLIFTGTPFIEVVPEMASSTDASVNTLQFTPA